MLAKIKSENPFSRYYDKILAVAVLIGLLVSLYYLTTIAKNRDKGDAQVESLREPKNVLEPFSVAPYEAAVRALRTPQPLAAPDIQQPGFLIPERRAQCVNKQCRKPIPLAAEKCPFCGQEQPKKAVIAEDNDSDGDGIPDKIELSWGLDPKNPADAKEDMDGDGFSNLDEYLAKTDPKDPKSHPALISLLRVKEIRGKKMPFIFSNFNRMPDGFQLVFNTMISHGQSAIYAKTNSVVGKTGFQVVKFVESSVKRRNQLKGFMETINTSTVTVRRLSDKKEVTLTIGQTTPVVTDMEAVITLPLDKDEHTVIEGGSFKVREDTYRVVAIDSAKKSVLIENEKDGKQKLVPSLQ